MSLESACLICGGKSHWIADLSREKILSGISSLMHVTFPQNTVTTSYSIQCCNECTLEFAWPAIPGNNEFYSLLASLPHYYTNDRPEYKVIEKFILEKNKPLRVLDVGCGNGSFLEKLLDKNNLELVGLDTTELSVEACKGKGLTAYCLPIEEFDDKNFDVIVSFHCLEHIPAPIPFMRAIMDRLKSGGTIIIATPYSPLSYETLWYHPLNNPPHHMLRLNERSYKMLADKLGLELTLKNFGATSLKSRIRTAMTYTLFNDNVLLSRMKFIKLILTHPFKFIKILISQLKRDRINGTVAGDDILAIFKMQ